MENAAQALLIAGGILLAILTLTTLVFMFNNMATIGNAQATKEETERLKNWNAEWEAYDKRVLYGAEVLTVINKAEQNNKEYDYSEKYSVKVEVYVGKTLISDPVEFIDSEQRKTSIFACENPFEKGKNAVEYSNETGRVNKIMFKFVE